MTSTLEIEWSGLSRRSWERSARRRRVERRLRHQLRALPLLLAQIRWARANGFLA